MIDFLQFTDQEKSLRLSDMAGAKSKFNSPNIVFLLGKSMARDLEARYVRLSRLPRAEQTASYRLT